MADRSKIYLRRNWAFPLIGLLIWAVILWFFETEGKKWVKPKKQKYVGTQTYSFQKISEIPLIARFKTLLFVDPYLYVAASLDGLAIYDCTDLSAPREVRPLNDFIHPLDIRYRQGLFYVADRFRGLLVLNFDDPRRPKILSETPVKGIATHISISGDLLVLSCGKAGVVIFKLAPPAAPEKIAGYDQDINYVKGATVVGDTLYMADNWEGGLKILSFDSGGSVNYIDQIKVGEYCDNARVIDNKLYALFREGGVIRFSIDFPRKPRPVYQVGWHGDAAMDFSVMDGFLLVAYSLGGLTLYGIQSGAKPEILTRQKVGHRALAMCRWENVVFVASASRGIWIYQILGANGLPSSVMPVQALLPPKTGR